MKWSVLLFCLVQIVFAAEPAVAARIAINVTSEHIDASDRFLTIDVSLPADVLRKRIDRAVLELPVAVGSSADEAFNAFPMIEFYQAGNADAKQTVLLAKGHRGLLRLDVTGLVRSWTTTAAKRLVVGSLSESNKTVFAPTVEATWPAGIEARLLIEYRERADG